MLSDQNVVCSLGGGGKRRGPMPLGRFLFENKALLGKTNHIRFLVLPIPIYVQNMKEIDFSTSAAECSMFTESRS